ncbi:purine-binding chemotaxis protein CheW [Xanthomonas campestris]|jgi:purine-binding chemotaxis protein CheW|uniref:Chemotaxis protein CheW n=3 Tax=Xanthomonas campestris pv. campestris TaxID=340 RepID=Q8P8C9_XANCP|nr:MULTISPECIES: chemotaxis protein CheW [Xanthomonas]AAM41592.1 chemotaxis protein [Xanthomonas campestris pv. campestris str. ATCC 33913]AAY48865.1 chemotaxis protein [Xanthomonas campestris pv. campestris str. 8004]AKS16031.1 membrane protein [Xanthomonas campestris pv. campestris]KIQ25811.1 membrane protein [Xanthomonas campestris]MBD8245463.1 purine-binding chemotaxis protein CheW [Xanthomonas campestris]
MDALTPDALLGDADAAAQYLTFQLDGETFATSILGIREIIQYRAPTPVPSMPACVRGVINLRGAVVPVVDLQARLGRADSSIGKRSCIVILATEQAQGPQVIGVLVDAVNAVIELADHDIEAAPSFGTHIRRDLLRGMGKVGERFVVLLEMEQVLRVDEIAGETDVLAA